MRCWDDWRETPVAFRAVMFIGLSIIIWAALQRPSEADVRAEIKRCIGDGGTPIVRPRHNWADEVYCKK